MRSFHKTELPRLHDFHWVYAAVVVVLAIFTYLPFLDLPPLPDDYYQAELGQSAFQPGGWRSVWSHPLYRCRATSLVVSGLTLHWFGFSAVVINFTSLGLHSLNCLLVYLLGSSRFVGWRISFVAALVFSARERHHEAVIWYAALPELLVFLFSAGTILLWLRWLETSRERWLVASVLTFVLALLSKESAVALCGVLPILGWIYGSQRRRAWTASAFFLAAGAVYFLASYLGQKNNQHYRDGTFEASLFFVPVLMRSIIRSYWIWGLLSLPLLLLRKPRRLPRICWFAALWVPLAIAPYSFLSYMPSVPSRHHYLAAMGVAILLSVAFWRVMRTRAAPLAIVLAPLIFLAHNWSYLWIHKKTQFAERAAPIEEFLRDVRRTRAMPPACPDLGVHCAELTRAVQYRLSGVEIRDYRTRADRLRK
jgi:uncharacterized membrane protein (UPF0136 family)